MLSLREAKQLRVRQPLSRLIVITQTENKLDEATPKVLERYKSHILDELNIKELEVADTLARFCEYKVEINPKIAGPKFGKELNTIRSLLEAASPKEIVQFIEIGQKVPLPLAYNDNQPRYYLDSEDIKVEQIFPNNLVVSSDANPIIILDIKITDELRREGWARDIVRHVQQLRKDSGLEIQNHIRITWSSDDANLQQAIRDHGDTIRKETLCDEMTQGGVTDGKEIDLSGQMLKIAIEKTS